MYHWLCRAVACTLELAYWIGALTFSKDLTAFYVLSTELIFNSMANQCQVLNLLMNV